MSFSFYCPRRLTLFIHLVNCSSIPCFSPLNSYRIRFKSSFWRFKMEIYEDIALTSDVLDFSSCLMFSIKVSFYYLREAIWLMHLLTSRSKDSELPFIVVISVSFSTIVDMSRSISLLRMLFWLRRLTFSDYCLVLCSSR